MEIKNPEHMVDFLVGQVHALFMVTQMLANAQPDPTQRKCLRCWTRLNNMGPRIWKPFLSPTRCWTECGKG